MRHRKQSFKSQNIIRVNRFSLSQQFFCQAESQQAYNWLALVLNCTYEKYISIVHKTKKIKKNQEYEYESHAATLHYILACSDILSFLLVKN